MLKHENTSPQLFIIAGPNGAGKTTSAQILLPELAVCEEYVNADTVAASIAPDNPEQVAIQAGRIMLTRIEQLASAKLNFALESTLSSKMFLRFIRRCQIHGYIVTILYFWLQSPELAIQRVKMRVERGGHNIPAEVVTRRYYRSMQNFLTKYTKLADSWYLYDNSGTNYEIIARKKLGAPLEIVNKFSWLTFNRRSRDEEAATYPIPEFTDVTEA